MNTPRLAPTQPRQNTPQREGEEPQQPQQDDNPQRNVEPFATADYSDNPMNPNPTLLRKIAAVASGGEADETVTAWATAINEQYPE
jgi:hypothetical protein